jgi:DNA-binding MarR family transcriptional regulator
MRSPPSVDVARQLLQVMNLLMRGFSARMRQGEGHVQPAHIGILARLEMGQCTLSELAQHQVVRLPTMSRSIDLLVRRGWVARSTPPENRRVTMVHLAADGRRVLAAIKSDAEAHVARDLAGLSAAERTQVAGALEVLVRALGPAAAAACGPAGAGQTRRTANPAPARRTVKQARRSADPARLKASREPKK